MFVLQRSTNKPSILIPHAPEACVIGPQPYYLLCYRKHGPLLSSILLYTPKDSIHSQYMYNCLYIAYLTIFTLLNFYFLTILMSEKGLSGLIVLVYSCKHFLFQIIPIRIISLGDSDKVGAVKYSSYTRERKQG